MGEYAELIAELKNHRDALERNSKITYLKILAEQQQMSNRTPSGLEFGTLLVAQGSPLAWYQLVPRNMRRNCIRIMSGTGGWVLATNDVRPTSEALVIATGAAGTSGRYTMLNGEALAFSGNPVPIYSTESIWACYTTSPTEAASITWIEEIFSNESAIPGIIPEDKANMPDRVQSLADYRVKDLVGDQESEYTREGVR